MLFLEDLKSFAKQLKADIYPGDCICLTGDLGTGKTTLVHAFLKEWGQPEDAPFSSPTFTVMNPYEFEDLTVCHLDFYRLDSFTEVENLDLLPVLESSTSIKFVEWGNKFTELLPFYSKKIHIEYVRGKALDRMVDFEGF